MGALRLHWNWLVYVSCSLITWNFPHLFQDQCKSWLAFVIGVPLSRKTLHTLSQGESFSYNQSDQLNHLSNWLDPKSIIQFMGNLCKMWIRCDVCRFECDEKRWWREPRVTSPSRIRAVRSKVACRRVSRVAKLNSGRDSVWREINMCTARSGGKWQEEERCVKLAFVLFWYFRFEKFPRFTIKAFWLSSGEGSQWGSFP